MKNNNYEKDGVKHYGYYVKVEKLILLEELKGKFEALEIKKIQGNEAEQSAQSLDGDIPF